MNDREYIRLSEELQAQIMKDRNIDKAPDPAIRRDPTRDKANLWRTAFVRDVEKILHCPYYNRYSDKTQVFTFYQNDDISRRALHVQLVSRIARNIGCREADNFHKMHGCTDHTNVEEYERFLPWALPFFQ